MDGGNTVTLPQEEITFNRKIAIDALRLNPSAHKQIKRKLTDKDDGYCAVGEIGEALHISPKIHTDSEVYFEVTKKLGIDNTGFIYEKNDKNWSFRQIADYLSEKWGLNQCP